MKVVKKVASYSLAALAGICFVGGVAVLAGGKKPPIREFSEKRTRNERF
jgi:hypothetical protein